jgi:acyl carrier protein
MEMKVFLDHFASQFDETDSTFFKPDTKFKDLDEWSSLLALSIIAMVDDEYGVKIKGDDIRNSETIQQLFNIVKSRV